MLIFTPDKLKKLKKAYKACKTDTFIFEGYELVKDYAKYLIEYLENKWKEKVKW